MTPSQLENVGTTFSPAIRVLAKGCRREPMVAAAGQGRDGVTYDTVRRLVSLELATHGGTSVRGISVPRSVRQRMWLSKCRDTGLAHSSVLEVRIPLSRVVLRSVGRTACTPSNGCGRDSRVRKHAERDIWICLVRRNTTGGNERKRGGQTKLSSNGKNSHGAPS